MNSGTRAALIAALSVLVAPFALAQTPITDATGRTFKVPDPVRKVFAAGPPASVFVLALAPEKLAGWLGRAIGANAAGESLAGDIETSLARIDTRVASIPVERRPKIFYARGPNGLATAPHGSLQAEVFEIAGARNVAEPPPGFAANLFTVSIEQVLHWQPDVIITLDPAFANAVRTRAEWQAVPAVRNNRIYVAPELPFGWVDAPPALNRMLGVEWLVRILHPQTFPEPLGPRIVDFHRRFYHHVPTDAQVASLLLSAGLPR